MGIEETLKELSELSGELAVTESQLKYYNKKWEGTIDVRQVKYKLKKLRTSLRRETKPLIDKLKLQRLALKKVQQKIRVEMLEHGITEIYEPKSKTTLRLISSLKEIK